MPTPPPDCFCRVNRRVCSAVLLFSIAILFSGAVLVPNVRGAGTVFTDVTVGAGLSTPQASVGPVDERVMTGGAAARDFDGDGWTDLIITRIDANPILYRNLGNGTFQDVTAGSGIVMAAGSNGAAWGDIDNDGDADLYITRADPPTSATSSGAHALFINDGTGHFTEEGATRGADLGPPGEERYGTSVSFGDYDRDGHIDVHVNEWGGGAFVGEATSHARLLHNDGTGSFTDTTVAAGVAMEGTVGYGPLLGNMPGVFNFSSRFTDLDGDGHTDLLMANDFGTSRVFWNDGDGTFTDGTAAANIGTDQNGMGLTVGDYDADGLLDFFVTSIYHDEPESTGHNAGTNYGVTGNRLFRNEGGRVFSDATTAAGVREGHWGWGTSFFDMDNDGDLDLMMTNGFPHGDFFTDPSRLWENNGDGTFTEVSAMSGVTDADQGRGLLTLDFDNDGDQDVLIINNTLAPVLYRNDLSNSNNWLELDLEGTVSNRDGLGARITVIPGDGEPMLIREVDGGSNYLSQSDSLVHFGLGDWAGLIGTIRIEWTSGVIQELIDVAPNQRLDVLEVVPEPSRVLLLLAGATAILMRRRRAS